MKLENWSELYHQPFFLPLAQGAIRQILRIFYLDFRQQH
jgi:hypothetical protein